MCPYAISEPGTFCFAKAFSLEAQGCLQQYRDSLGVHGMKGVCISISSLGISKLRLTAGRLSLFILVLALWKGGLKRQASRRPASAREAGVAAGGAGCSKKTLAYGAYSATGVPCTPHNSCGSRYMLCQWLCTLLCPGNHACCWFRTGAASRRPHQLSEGKGGFGILGGQPQVSHPGI